MVIEPNKPTIGLRLIAIIEAAKGILGLMIGFGLHAFAGHHVHPFIKSIGRHFHLRDGAHSPHFLVEMLNHPEKAHLGLLTVIAVLYSALRFTEAYGLWWARRWGEWIALVSVVIYVPFEVYALVQGVSALKALLLVVNLALVIYLAMVLKATKRKRAKAGAAMESAAEKSMSDATPG